MLTGSLALCNRGMAEMDGANRGREFSRLEPEISPGLFGQREENFDDFRVELLAGTADDFFGSGGERGSSAVGPVGGHGVKRVGDGEDAGAEGNLFTAKAPRVAGAVEALLVCVNDLGGFAEEGYFADHRVAALAVLLHNGHLFGIEPAGFEEDGVGRGDLADVVEEGSASDRAEIVGFNAHSLRERDGVGG